LAGGSFLPSAFAVLKRLGISRRDETAHLS